MKKFTELGKDSWRALIYPIPPTLGLAAVRYFRGQQDFLDVYALGIFYLLVSLAVFSFAGEGKDDKPNEGD